MADPTPDPHRNEPAPAPQEGMRPEADPTVVRPESDEPSGPLPGLLKTAAAEAATEVSDAPEAEEQLDAAGVEEEGIESGQIMGVTVAILVTVFLLGFTVFWAFYVPKLGATEDEAESGVELSSDGQRLNAEAEALIGDYSLKTDSSYTLPIGVAMEGVAAQYAGDASSAALEGDVIADRAPLAATRQGFNVAPIMLEPARAIRSAGARGSETSTGSTTTETDAGRMETGEEIGVDEIDADAASGVMTESSPSLDE